MASVTQVKEQFKGQLKTIGAAALNALFPNDFSYYSVALELVDSNNQTVDYFLFPVNPNEVREVHQELTRVRKTITGVSSLKNPTFNPVQIFLTGDFGKTFKIIVNGQALEFAGISIQGGQSVGKSLVSSAKNFVKETPQFSSFAKTGYGCLKVIERIKNKSRQLDDSGKPHSLYLYNPILGGNYLVEFVSYTPSETIARNTIPMYTIQLTAIAPLDVLLGRLANLKSSAKNLVMGTLQKSANSLANNVRSLVGG